MQGRVRSLVKMGTLIAAALGAVAVDFTSKFLSMIADFGFELVVLVIAVPLMWREITRQEKK